MLLRHFFLALVAVCWSRTAASATRGIYTPARTRSYSGWRRTGSIAGGNGDGFPGTAGVNARRRTHRSSGGSSNLEQVLLSIRGGHLDDMGSSVDDSKPGLLVEDEGQKAAPPPIDIHHTVVASDGGRAGASAAARRAAYVGSTMKEDNSTTATLAVTLRGGGRARDSAKKGRAKIHQKTTKTLKGEGSGISFRWPMFSAFLYVLAMALTIPGLPRVVNEMITGSKAVTAKSATVYGLLASTDAFFTLLTVNFHASMSDKYGRRPFMALSALGLGTGFTITYFSRKVWMLLVAAAIDGCTSCMYSLAQASITDCVGKGPRLSEAFGLFQGISLGMAFMIGMPAGGVLASKFGARFPLLLGACICALNFLIMTFVMPETLPENGRKEKVEIVEANPMGAVRMASRNKLMAGVAGSWMLIWVAHVGMQMNWINYTDRKFEWGVAQSGASLALMGLLVAVFPKLIIPRLGLERSITSGLLAYAFSQALIAVAPGVRNKYSRFGTPVVVSGLVMASAGTVVFPAILALLSDQVGGEEKGAVQGAADTGKTICSVLFGPAMTWVFGYYIGESARPRQIEGANYYLGSVVALAAWAAARHTFAAHGSLKRQSAPNSKNVTR